VFFFSSMISDSLIIRDSFQLRDSIAQSGIKVKEPSRLLFLLERPEGSHVVRNDDRRDLAFTNCLDINTSKQRLPVAVRQYPRALMLRSSTSMTTYSTQEIFNSKYPDLDLREYFEFIQERSLPAKIKFETANHHILPRWAFPEVSSFRRQFQIAFSISNRC
jgi:hypothetical protein